jgi:hypothetical protein
MRNLRTGAVHFSLVFTFPLTFAMLGLLVACISAPDHPDWIHIDVTTKSEVIAHYGQPDWVIASPGGDTVVYRRTAFGPSAPRLEIPTAQTGPFGTAATGMQLIDPGLGATDLNGKAKKRLRKEIRIHYDDWGIVRELSSS